MQWFLGFPWLPWVGIGMALVVIGVTPEGNETVLYIGSGTAALIALFLSILPLPDVEKRRNQVGWVFGVLFTMTVAFIFPALPLVAPAGLVCIGVGIALFVLQNYIKSRLTAVSVLRYHVRRTTAIDYAGIYEVRDGIVSCTYAYPDRNNESQTSRIAWQMERFALPGNVRDQIDTWDQIAGEVHSGLGKLNPALVTSSQGENVRVLFDIDMGGFFYYRLNTNRFFFAASLDQSAMNDNSFDRAAQILTRELMAVTSVQQAQG